MNLSQVDRIKIEATARQYIAGRLSEDEETQFETRMLQDPRVAQEVEITRRMRDGLQQLQRKGALDLVTPPRLTLKPRIQLAAAAAIVLALAATTLYYVRPAPSSTILTASTRALPDFGDVSTPMTYLLAERRSNDHGLLIQMPDPRSVIQLNILPARPDVAGQYRIELRHAEATPDSKPLARVESGSQGLIPVFLNTSELTTGRYVLTVVEPEASGPSPAKTQYTFTLTDPQ